MSSNKRSMSDDSKSDNASQARSYPRKRVSIACEVCRLRKTRCDAAKPACSFCSELGIECTYKRPTDATRPEPKSEELVQALTRLDKIEATLECIAQKVGAQDLQQRYVPEQTPFINTPLPFRNEPLTPSPASVCTNTAAKPGKRRYAAKMPTLLTFKHPLPDYSDWSWNCTASFFNHQMETIEDMRQHVSNLPIPEPDFNEPHLWSLHRSFADNILKWLPLFDPDTAASHLRYARETRFQHTGSSLCVVFLIFANGAISQDHSPYSRSAHELPGFAYYARALSILERLPATSKDLTALQCRILVTVYLLFAMRPLEAWKNITLASQECVLLLRANTNDDPTLDHLEQFREAFRRIYWICYVLENELEACLEVPSSGIRLYEAQVPLPISHYEEDGMYFLLALASLRKVMVEVLDTVGYKSLTGSVTYNPAVALELRTQIDQWYHHLPGPLRFQLDSNMLFDTRKAYLRCAYYALMAVATWPFVIPLSQEPFSEPTRRQSHDMGLRRQSHDMTPRRQSHDMGPPPPIGPTSHPSQESVPRRGSQNQPQQNASPAPTSISTQDTIEPYNPSNDPAYRAAAHACLAACRTYLTYAEEILTSKTLVSHLIVRQYFAFTMILILCFNGVDLQDPDSFDDRKKLEDAMRNLQYWGVVPFMGDCLAEMERVGKARGLGRRR